MKYDFEVGALAAHRAALLRGARSRRAWDGSGPRGRPSPKAVAHRGDPKRDRYEKRYHRADLVNWKGRESTERGTYERREEGKREQRNATNPAPACLASRIHHGHAPG